MFLDAQYFLANAHKVNNLCDAEQRGNDHYTTRSALKERPHTLVLVRLSAIQKK